jgi:predicted 3-demethylubiquinone-9 3-methyltransferase (glyoxalase superfamily)
MSFASGAGRHGMPNVTPSLWFDGDLEEAARFYTSVFPNSSIEEMHADPGSGGILYGAFVLDGQRFLGINGGPQFPFTEAVSFEITCADQDEVDYYWSHLLDGGQESQCGWLKDRYGLSWQIVPKRLYELVGAADPAVANAAMAAMMPMRKIVVADLEAAVAHL